MRTPLTVTSLDEVQAAVPPAPAPGQRGVVFTSLEDVQVASPCTADWDGMAGDDRMRFCSQCGQRVYNLSAMPKEQALSLLRERERTPCVRFYRRRDGTVMTADCPVASRRLVHNTWRWTAMKLAAVFAIGMGLLGWVVGRPRATVGVPSSCGTSNSRPGVIMGQIGRPPQKAGAGLDGEKQDEGRQPEANNDGDDEAPPRP